MPVSTIFTTCWDKSFDQGGMALVRSIRHFYSPNEAYVLAFIDERPCGDEVVSRLARMKVDVRQMNGVNMLQAKAFVTAYALNFRLGGRDGHYADRVLHIDADAFLTGRVHDMFAEKEGVVAFGDTCGVGMPEYEAINGCLPPVEQSRPEEDFLCNAGIVFYTNGPTVREFVRDFSDTVANPYLWAVCRNDQNIWRSVLAHHVLTRGLNFVKSPDGMHYNPIGGVADELTIASGVWVNAKSGKPQRIWHGVGARKPWRDKVSTSVRAAFEWASNR